MREKSRRIGRLAWWVAFVLGLAACKSDESGGEPAVPSKEQVESLFQGSAPTVPEEAFEGVGFDTTFEELEEMYPRRARSPVASITPITEEDYENVGLEIRVDDKIERVDELSVLLEAGSTEEATRKLLSVAEQTWGEKSAVYDKELGSETTTRHVWFNPGEGIRAHIFEGGQNSAHLVFSTYLPVAELLGEDGKELGFAEGPVLGESLASICETYGQKVRAQWNQDEKKAVCDDLESTGAGEWKQVVERAEGITLRYPPTEFGTIPTDVNLYFDADGRVERFSLSIPFVEGVGDWRSEVYERLETKYGEPEPAEYLQEEAKLYDEDPKIYVRDDSLSEDIDITVKSR